MINKEEIKNIKSILLNVTKGPWVSVVEGRDQDSGSSFIQTGEPSYDINFDNLRVADQDFIAMARNILPILVDEIEKLYFDEDNV